MSIELYHYTVFGAMETSGNQSFHAADYAIFFGVLGVSLAIGLYHALTGGQQKTTNEFLMANRHMKTFPVAVSILVSFVSGILVLGTPAEMYTHGTQLFMRTIGYCVACLISGILFVPLFFYLKVTSSFEYLEQRYNSKLLKLIGSTSMLIGNMFYMGLVIYAPATALEAVTGFNIWASVVASGIIATIYTTMGGIKAVIWTDVFQAGVIITGMLIIVIKGVLEIGGLERVWNINKEGGRLIFFNIDPDPTQRLSFWSAVIGGTFSTLAIFGIGQTSVQRFCTLPTVTHAKKAVYLNIPFLVVINILSSLVGLVIYAHYADKKCDPLKSKAINNANQLVPYYVIDVLNIPGLPGAFLAVLFSGALSSLSSSLNSAAAVTWQDILRYFFIKTSERNRVFINKLLVIIYGLLGIFMTYIARLLGGHVLWASLSFAGATMGPTLGIFLLGAIVPFANSKGAICGILISSGFSIWLSIGAFVIRPHRSTLLTSIKGCSNLLNNSEFDTSLYGINDNIAEIKSELPSFLGLTKMYEISFLWYCAIGCLMAMFIGIIVSFITKSKDEKDIDPHLIIPVVCCCPLKHINENINNMRADIPTDIVSIKSDQ